MDVLSRGLLPQSPLTHARGGVFRRWPVFAASFLSDGVRMWVAQFDSIVQVGREFGETGWSDFRAPQAGRWRR